MLRNFQKQSPLIVLPKRTDDRGKKVCVYPSPVRSLHLIMTINQIDVHVSKVAELTAQLSASLRRPSRRTLTLIDKALSYLTPFESPLASTASPAERHDLLALLEAHRLPLSPYIDTDRIERNLRSLR